MGLRNQPISASLLPPFNAHAWQTISPRFSIPAVPSNLRCSGVNANSDSNSSASAALAVVDLHLLAVRGAVDQGLRAEIFGAPHAGKHCCDEVGAFHGVFQLSTCAHANRGTAAAQSGDS